MRDLLYHPERKFSELNHKNIPSDQLSFHLRRLGELNLIRKTEGGYELTASGKEFANRFDTEDKKMILERQAKIGVLVSCTKQENGKNLYLFQQRLKQPSYGHYGFITGKVKWGESVFETASRELSEETGLEAKLSLAGIEHKIDYSETGELLEDKYFFVFRGDDPQGKLIENFEGGRNLWLDKDKALKLPDLFGDVPAVLDACESKTFRFWEQKFTVEKY